MTLTRFSFGGVGIFHALSTLEDFWESPDYEDMKWAEGVFDQTLTIPTVAKEQKTVSYFTDQGLLKFQEPLEILKDLFLSIESPKIGMFKEESTEKEKLQVLYEDEFQVIASLPE